MHNDNIVMKAVYYQFKILVLLKSNIKVKPNFNTNQTERPMSSSVNCDHFVINFVLLFPYVIIYGFLHNK